MNFKFSADELVVIVSALREEYRKSCEFAMVARKKQSIASTVEVAREFLEIANYHDKRCGECVKLYDKILHRNLVEDL